MKCDICGGEVDAADAYRDSRNEKTGHKGCVVRARANPTATHDDPYDSGYACSLVIDYQEGRLDAREAALRLVEHGLYWKDSHGTFQLGPVLSAWMILAMDLVDAMDEKLKEKLKETNK